MSCARPRRRPVWGKQGLIDDRVGARRLVQGVRVRAGQGASECVASSCAAAVCGLLAPSRRDAHLGALLLGVQRIKHALRARGRLCLRARCGAWHAHRSTQRWPGSSAAARCAPPWRAGGTALGRPDQGVCASSQHCLRLKCATGEPCRIAQRCVCGFCRARLAS